MSLQLGDTVLLKPIQCPDTEISGLRDVELEPIESSVYIYIRIHATSTRFIDSPRGCTEVQVNDVHVGRSTTCVFCVRGSHSLLCR